MEEEINFDEIENLVDKSIKGEVTVLNKWFDDASFTQKCIFILNSQDVRFKTAFFAINVLLRHVDRFFCFWEPSVRYEFSQFILGLANSKENLLNENHPLLTYYSKLAGTVIAEGWNSDERFQAFLVDIAQSQPKSIINNKISLSILEELSESMRILRVSSFAGIPLASIINYSLQSIKFSENNQEIINASLKSILSALNFYAIGYEYKNEDLKRIIALDIETQNILLNSELIQQLFSLASVEPAQCFEILTIIVSCKFNINEETRKNMLAAFVNQIINCIDLDLNSDALNHFFRLIYRLKIEIDHTYQLRYEFSKFVQKVFEKSEKILDRTSSYQDDRSTISNIFSFFETIDEEKEKGKPKLFEFLFYAKLKIVKSFTLAAMTLLSPNEQFDLNSFGLDESEHFHPWFMSINKIVNINAPQMLDILFTSINDDTLNPEQVAFMCTMILTILYDQNKPLENSIDKYVEAFSDSIIRLLVVYKNYIQSPPIINSFLLFLRHLEKYKFLFGSDFSHKLYLKFGERMNIKTSEQMLQYLFEILFTLFQNCDQKKYILDGCKALSYLFNENKYFHPYVIRVPLVSYIVKIRVETPFPFLLKESFSQARTVFHSSIATILVNKDADQLRSCYLSIYDMALTKPTPSTAPLSGTIDESIWGFLCDFTGFFKFTTKKEEFDIFFYYLYTHKHFESLIGYINKITSFSPSILIQLLKFWNALLDNKIEFRHHSEEGIILFHFALDSLKTIIKLITPELAPGADLTRKTVYYIFRIINSLLAANYVPYKCFDRYHDTGLIDLLSIFNLCLGAAPPSELTQYPKLEKILMKLTITICSHEDQHHLEETAKLEVMCTPVILDIINFGLRSNDPFIRENSISCFSAFMKFRGIFVRVKSSEDSNETVGLDLNSNPNAGLMTVIPKEKLTLTCCGLWNMLLANRKQNVIACIQDIFQRLPEMLEFVYSKMEQFLIHDEQVVEKFKMAYGDFFNACSFMFQNRDVSHFSDEINKFVDNALKCLRAPTRVFAMV